MLRSAQPCVSVEIIVVCQFLFLSLFWLPGYSLGEVIQHVQLRMPTQVSCISLDQIMGRYLYYLAFFLFTRKMGFKH